MPATVIANYWEFNFRQAQLAVASKNQKYLYIGNLNQSIFSLVTSTSLIRYYLKFNYFDICFWGEQKIY